MWPFWSRDPAKDFPYEIGNALNSFHEYTFWYLHEGKKKVPSLALIFFLFFPSFIFFEMQNLIIMLLIFIFTHRQLVNLLLF